MEKMREILDSKLFKFIQKYIIRKKIFIRKIKSKIIFYRIGTKNKIKIYAASARLILSKQILPQKY